MPDGAIRRHSTPGIQSCASCHTCSTSSASPASAPSPDTPPAQSAAHRCVAVPPRAGTTPPRPASPSRSPCHLSRTRPSNATGSHHQRRRAIGVKRAPPQPVLALSHQLDPLGLHQPLHAGLGLQSFQFVIGDAPMAGVSKRPAPSPRCSWPSSWGFRSRR